MLHYLRQFLGVTTSADTIGNVPRDDIVAEIHTRAASGFETSASTLEAIVESYLDEQTLSSADHSWIESKVTEAFARKRVEEASWTNEETDVDRLAAAFDALNAAEIIALHDAGYTQSDGFTDAVEEQAQWQSEGKTARAYTFYHRQDVDAAVRGGGIYLAFGAFNKETNETAIATEIVAAMEAVGLRVEWSGDVKKRILLTPFAWCKRAPDDG